MQSRAYVKSFGILFQDTGDVFRVIPIFQIMRTQILKMTQIRWLPLAHALRTLPRFFAA
jgi:hypothetical protein